MSTLYIIVLAILLLLAIFDLVVGVSNDASNFLSSATGCRAAGRAVILSVAAAGIIIGSAFAGGMMEVARSGIFIPGQFTFHDVMMIFLAVMLTDVILLDLFNTFGLPTSTTVSLVFELLGAALAAALFTMSMNGVAVSQNLGDYINSGKTLEIISGIFCSVGVAFTVGCVVMWVARLLFSFRYKASYRYIGPMWSALALTAITYFAVFKGLKSSSIMPKDLLSTLDANIALATLLTFVGWTLICAILQYILKVNTLKLTVLVGTGALALAFAGNDLVNFIGVSMGAFTAFEAAQVVAQSGGDYTGMSMEVLAGKVQVNNLWLIAAGLVMVGALIFSKKARTVTETGVNLARSKSDKERFGSCLPARALVRGTIKSVQFITRITPAPVAKFVGARFRPLEEAEQEDVAFDLVRASVNLTVAALLISLATSLKLPLSTTYVTFMVAMGSSLADRAWGRDSAVYRITGVLTVIGGWFLTGMGALTAAFITATVILWGGVWGIGIMLVITAAILVKNALRHRRGLNRNATELDPANDESVREFARTTAQRLETGRAIYSRLLPALHAEDRSALKKCRNEAREINRDLKSLREDVLLPKLRQLATGHATRGQLLFRLTESHLYVAERLVIITKAAYKHIDNNHTGLSPDQFEDLQQLCSISDKFVQQLCDMLQTMDFSQLTAAEDAADTLSHQFAEGITRHLVRGTEDEFGIRNGLLYINLLNETRSMFRKMLTLTRDMNELARNLH